MTKSEKKDQEKVSSKDVSEAQKNGQKEKKVTPLKESTLAIMRIHFGVLRKSYRVMTIKH